MKYMNTRYGLFDTYTFQNWYQDTENGGGFSGGEGKITLNAQTTKLYASIELWATGNYSSASCWPLQIFFSDSAYNKFDLSCVQIYYDCQNSAIALCTNDKERLKISSCPAQKWHKVYVVADSVAGTIDFYVNGYKVGTYIDYVKTGVTAISAKVKATYNGSIYSKVKNIIISDDFFPINETLKIIPANVTTNGWTFNSSTNLYATETENSELTVTPDFSGLEGYKVTALNVGTSTTVLGDTIKKVNLQAGSYDKTLEIPTTGSGIYWEGVPKNQTIKIKSKK